MTFDDRVIFAIQKLRTPARDKFFRFFTHIAEYGIMWTAVSVIFFLFNKTRALGVELAIALALCMIIGELYLKRVIRRPRPFVHHPEVQMVVHKPKDFSHPSGHSTSCFSCATVLLFFDWRIGLVMFIFALIIGFSRIYLFVHYPLDVIIGAVWGVVFGVLAVCIYAYAAPYVNIDGWLGWAGFSITSVESVGYSTVGLTR